MQSSEKIKSRVGVWEEALTNAYQYSLLLNYNEKLGSQEADYTRYSIGSRQGIFHTTLTIRNALLEASVVNFCSIFSSGYQGKMMASNMEDEIKETRSRIIKNTAEKLGWRTEEIDELLTKIKTQRDSLLAHYDGETGDYKEQFKGIFSRKMVGVHLMPDEIEKYRACLAVMVEVTHLIAYGK